jgi:hypothetical protein
MRSVTPSHLPSSFLISSRHSIAHIRTGHMSPSPPRPTLGPRNNAMDGRQAPSMDVRQSYAVHLSIRRSVGVSILVVSQHVYVEYHILLPNKIYLRLHSPPSPRSYLPGPIRHIPGPDYSTNDLPSSRVYCPSSRTVVVGAYCVVLYRRQVHVRLAPVSKGAMRPGGSIVPALVRRMYESWVCCFS